MNEIERINEIKEKMDSFYFNETYLILAIGVVIAFIVGAIVVKKSKSDKPPATLVALFVFFVFACGYFLMSMAYVSELRIELKELELAVMLDSIESEVTIETTNIVKSMVVEDKYCVHMELKDTYCTYLEFASNKGITQVLIPLENTVSADKENPLKITYFDLTKEQRDHLNKTLLVETHAINDTIKLYKNGWSLGVSVSTAP